MGDVSTKTLAMGVSDGTGKGVKDSGVTVGKMTPVSQAGDEHSARAADWERDFRRKVGNRIAKRMRIKPAVPSTIQRNLGILEPFLRCINDGANQVLGSSG